MSESSAAQTVRPGVVSVVLVNYRGAEDTITCISYLRELTWPAARLEIVVVENASGDNSATVIRAAAPDILLIESTENTGFAGGCNLGARHSSGEYIAFINSDARPHPGWLDEAITVLEAESQVGAVASKVLDWDGEKIDFVGGNINFIGQGYKLEAGRVDDGSYESPRDVLFPTGSAAVVRTDLFRELGGFDERYFMFYEDVDLGWRMNLRGHRVRYCPSSIVFHKHHASIAKFGSYRERYLLARNSLLTIYKNFGDDALNRVLAPALLLAVREGVLQGAADTTVLDLQRTGGGDEEPSVTVSKESLVGAYAVDFLMENLGELGAQRAEIQKTRTRSDASMGRLFGDLLQGTSAAPGFHAEWLKAIQAFDLEDDLIPRQRVVVITADTVSAQMAGPAIRAFHIAEELSAENDVTLVSTTTCTLENPKFECEFAVGDKLREIVGRSDIVIFQGFVLHHEPWIGETDKIVVVDIYDPMHLEQLEQSRAQEPLSRSANISATTQILNDQLGRGDFFLCASDEQRHFWLGQLAAVGRLNPSNYDRDSSMESLLAIAPFGLGAKPPVQTRAAIKGVVPGISADSKVILWGGGVYNWFDPLTLIRAVDELRSEHDEVRLFFLGMKHPNPNVPEMRMAWDARQLSDTLGLTDKFVFFNDTWVDYEDRQNFLLDADIGVSTHFLHVETTFSFRTRMLDYLWAGLPIVATEGDAFGRLIVTEGLGIAVPERDAPALAAALRRVLYDEPFAASCRANIDRVRDEFQWGRALRPLIEFCRNPSRAADIGQRRLSGASSIELRRSKGLIARNFGYVRVHFEREGVGGVMRYGAAKLLRVATRPAQR